MTSTLFLQSDSEDPFLLYKTMLENHPVIFL